MKAYFFGAKKWSYTNDKGNTYNGYTVFLSEAHEEGSDFYLTPIKVPILDKDGNRVLKNLSCSDSVMLQATNKPFKDLFGHIVDVDVKIGTNKITSLIFK